MSPTVSQLSIVVVTEKKYLVSLMLVSCRQVGLRRVAHILFVDSTQNICTNADIWSIPAESIRNQTYKWNL